MTPETHLRIIWSLSAKDDKPVRELERPWEGHTTHMHPRRNLPNPFMGNYISLIASGIMVYKMKYQSQCSECFHLQGNEWPWCQWHSQCMGKQQEHWRSTAKSLSCRVHKEGSSVYLGGHPHSPWSWRQATPHALPGKHQASASSSAGQFLCKQTAGNTLYIQIPMTTGLRGSQ